MTAEEVGGSVQVREGREHKAGVLATGKATGESQNVVRFHVTECRERSR
jgi:hypothetical protein